MKHLTLSENDKFLKVIGNGLGGAKIFAHFGDLDSGLFRQSEKMVHSILTGEDHTREFVMTNSLFAEFLLGKSVHLDKRTPVYLDIILVLYLEIGGSFGFRL